MEEAIAIADELLIDKQLIVLLKNKRKIQNIRDKKGRF
jgi:hypothetical protein